jgi:hypothetical protein
LRIVSQEEGIGRRSSCKAMRNAQLAMGNALTLTKPHRAKAGALNGVTRVLLIVADNQR